jgi:hypothetical protein
MDTESETIIIPLNKGRSTLILLGAIAFIGLAIWFIINPPLRYNPLLIRILGTAVILFFGFGAFKLFQKLIEKNTGLTIDNTGIIVNTGIIKIGLVPWENVREINTIKIKNQDIIIIAVANPEEYINKQSGAFPRQLADINYKVYGSPIGVSANDMKCSFDELREILQSRFIKWKNQKVVKIL